MTTVTAPAPGAVAPAPDVPTPATPTARVLERAVPATVALRLSVVVAGLIVVGAGDTPLSLGVALGATLLAGTAGARVLRAGGGRSHEARTTTDLVASVVAVLLSGGWASPFGAVLAIDLAVAGLARGYRRAFVLATGIALLYLAAGTVTATVPTAASTPLPVLLVLGAALGGFAHGLTADDEHAGLGHAVHLADANRLVVDLHASLRSLPTAPDAETVSRAALDWLRPRLAFSAAAILVHDGHGPTVVHAEGATVTEETVRSIVADLAPGVRVDRTPGAGLTAAGRAARIPLVVHGRRVGVLALDLDEVPVDEASARRVLTTLADPLAVALDTARWFGRLGTLTGELERSRLATDLAERLCQSMAATIFALDRAAARTGDVELFRVADAVRRDVTDLRHTLDDLRATIDDDTDLAAVVAGCVDRAASRSGVLATVEVDAPDRAPRVVEQQLLRGLQELLAVVEDATVVSVRWRSRDGAVAVTVTSDGLLLAPRSVRQRADAIGASLTTTATGGAVLAIAPEVPA